MGVLEVRPGGVDGALVIAWEYGAGKTTLTEKFLLYSGAVQVAGAVHAREGRRSARSDWMELEQQRGISISSTVLQFPYVVHGRDA